jgi:hypothetical protein
MPSSELTEKQKEQAKREAMEIFNETKKPKKAHEVMKQKSKVENLDTGIKFYFDVECKRPIEKVKWDKGFQVTMADGKIEVLDNTVEVGNPATATFFVRNETNHRFGVQKLEFPDERVRCTIQESWLMPMRPVKVVLTIKPSTAPIKVVESAQFFIEGFFIIE